MKEIKIKQIKVITFGVVNVTWEDDEQQTIDITSDLKKPLFSKVNESNFNDITIVYDSCAIGWPLLDVEIGLLRWRQEINSKAA
jgi:hypothetical protein